jgi:hypothetical protein
VTVVGNYRSVVEDEIAFGYLGEMLACSMSEFH